MGEEGGRGLIATAVALFRPFGASFGEVAGQFNVLAHRQERQQIELLEDVAGVVDAEAVAGTGTEFGQFLAKQANAAAIRFLHATEQAEQGGFATAAGAFEEQGFARLQAKRRDIQQRRVTGPAEAQVGQFDECLGHSADFMGVDLPV